MFKSLLSNVIHPFVSVNVRVEIGVANRAPAALLSFKIVVESPNVKRPLFVKTCSVVPFKVTKTAEPKLKEAEGATVIFPFTLTPPDKFKPIVPALTVKFPVTVNGFPPTDVPVYAALVTSTLP